MMNDVRIGKLDKSILAYYIGDTFIDTGTVDYMEEKYGFNRRRIYNMIQNQKIKYGQRYNSTPIMIVLEPYDDEGNPIE